MEVQWGMTMGLVVADSIVMLASKVNASGAASREVATKLGLDSMINGAPTVIASPNPGIHHVTLGSVQRPPSISRVGNEPLGCWLGMDAL